MPKYEWSCGACRETFAGYRDAQGHVTQVHPGEHGVIEGVIDTDTDELVLEGFGPKILQIAQQRGLMPKGSKKAKGERGSGDNGKSRTADTGIKVRELYRDVWLDLPLLETLFQRCRETFSEGYEDTDEGFSVWLHDVVINALRPYVGMLWGTGAAEVAAQVQQTASRKQMSDWIRDPRKIMDSELEQLAGSITDAVIWTNLVLPHHDRIEERRGSAA